MSLRLAAAGLTDPGRRRSRNEDAFLIDSELGLVVVADGMGGHPEGHIASALAAAELSRQLTGPGPAPASDGTQGESHSPLCEWMAKAVMSADARVRSSGAVTTEREGMGTTLTALLVRSEERLLIVGHVGDSRAYLYEEGRLRQLTRDQTWVQKQVDSGALLAEAVSGHPWAHVLVQAVGVGDDISPELLEQEARPGQIYLLCTDGLTNMLSDAAIERMLEEALPSGLDAAARELVAAANDQDGVDNITVVLVRLEEA